MKWIFRIMFVIDMLFIAFVRHVDGIQFLNLPVYDIFSSFELCVTVLTSQWMKVLVLLILVLLLQALFIYFLFGIARGAKDLTSRKIEEGTFFQNIEYQYIPSYLGISILAFSLSEQYQYLVVLALFCLFLINTRIIFFSPWLKLLRNYRLYVLSVKNKEELLLLRGDNNEDNSNLNNLVSINTDVFISLKK